MAASASLRLEGVASRMTEPAPRAQATDHINLGSREVTLTGGTGVDQAEQHWHGTGTVGAGLSVDLDLTALTGGAFGTTISFTRIVLLFVELTSPDGTLVLRIGPQGVADAWKGWFSDVLAANWEELRQWLLRLNTKGGTPGWPVSATEKVLRLHNPGGTNVDYQILLLGV